MLVGDKNKHSSLFLSNTLCIGMWHLFRQHHFVGVSQPPTVPLEFRSEPCGQEETHFWLYEDNRIEALLLWVIQFQHWAHQHSTLTWDGRGIVPFSMSYNRNSEIQQQWLTDTVGTLPVFLHLFVSAAIFWQNRWCSYLAQRGFVKTSVCACMPAVFSFCSFSHLLVHLLLCVICMFFVF